MAKVIETLDGLEGKRDLSTIHPDDPDQKSPAFRWEEIILPNCTNLKISANNFTCKIVHVV